MITERQREQRKKFIGSSDVPVILGLVPQKSPGDIWAVKTGQLIDNYSGSVGDSVDVGNRLESFLAKWAEEIIRAAGMIAATGKTKLRRNVRRVSQTYKFMAANLDAVMQDGSILEIKTSNKSEEWGDPWTDQVPQRVLAQVLFQMRVARAERAFVAALIGGGHGGMRFQIYRIAAHDALQSAIEGRCVEFWNSYVLPRIPPPEAPRLETLERMIREPGKRAAIPGDVLGNYIAAQERAREAEAALKRARAEILMALGDAEEGEASGVGTCTYLEVCAQTIDTKALRLEAPSLADRFSKTSAYRKLLVKPEKKGGE